MGSGIGRWDTRCTMGRCGELLAVTVALTPVKEGEGGFVVVRGSHKSAFPRRRASRGTRRRRSTGIRRF